MPTQELEKREQRSEVEERVDHVERILPTLATKEDLRATEERLRTHFDVVTEGLRDLIRVVAEGVSTV